MKYKKLIDAYCEEHAVTVPIGFSRTSASRYAVIDLSTNLPKLVARTWFKMEDVVYYLRHLADGVPVRILDFKEGVELLDNGGARLTHGQRLT